MSEERPATYFESAEEWRSWLEENHDSARELWLGFWKKHTGHPGLAYPDAVEQALCFGWIDGVLNRLDDRRHRIRFTPRRRGSTWSNVNVAKVAELESRGLMTDAGRATFEARSPEGEGVYAYKNDAVALDPDRAARLAASPAALAFFEAQPPSYRKIATRWVMSAKREETRDRRMAELVADCEASRLIKPMRYGRNNDSG